MATNSLIELGDFRLHKILEPGAVVSVEETQHNLIFWVRRYLDERVAGVGSPHTWKAKARDLAHFYRFFVDFNGGDTRIDHWRRRDTEAFREELINKGYKPSSVNRFLATVKHFGRYCEEQRVFTDECPVSGVKNVPFEEPEAKGLDRSEVHRIFKSLEDLVRMRPGWESSRDGAIFHLLYRTGIRVTELCHLEGKNYDGSWLRGFRSKGGNFRSVYVPVQARSKLDGYLALRHSTIDVLRTKYGKFFEENPDKSEEWPSWRDLDERWIFLNRYGGQLSRQHVYKLLRKIGDHAHVHYGMTAKLFPHRLRHAFALEKLEKRGDPVLVAQLLGHRSLQHVARYTRRREDAIERIMDEEVI